MVEPEHDAPAKVELHWLIRKVCPAEAVTPQAATLTVSAAVPLTANALHTPVEVG